MGRETVRDRTVGSKRMCLASNNAPMLPAPRTRSNWQRCSSTVPLRSVSAAAFVGQGKGGMRVEAAFYIVGACRWCRPAYGLRMDAVIADSTRGVWGVTVDWPGFAMPPRFWSWR